MTEGGTRSQLFRLLRIGPLPLIAIATVMILMMSYFLETPAGTEMNKRYRAREKVMGRGSHTVMALK